MPFVTTKTVAAEEEMQQQHQQWRKPRNHFSISQTDPNPQIQSNRCKSTISSLLLSTFSNETTTTTTTSVQSHANLNNRKKSNFSVRRLGCTAGASQQVSVPAVIRASADWEGKKGRKKKQKQKKKVCHVESSSSCGVDFQDVWCGPPGIGFSAVDCVVSKKNGNGRPKIDVNNNITHNHRERSSTFGRRVNPETFPFLDIDTDPTDPDIFTTCSFGTETYTRRVRDPSSDDFPEIMMLQGSLLMGRRLNSQDHFRDWRLDVDNMSYEQLLELGERIGHVNTGLKEDEMGHNIRKTKLQLSDNNASKHQVDKKCSICQEEYEADDEVGRLNCEHLYHFECIQQWVAHKNFCPVCKKQVAARH